MTTERSSILTKALAAKLWLASALLVAYAATLYLVSDSARASARASEVAPAPATDMRGAATAQARRVAASEPRPRATPRTTPRIRTRSS